ncbi:hypothetical protein RRG08_043095 [Elysia crispata]|uniref:Amine oxidase n=1 Tax=Elysia crispata TaxID=231223 RepID=A0AAE1CPH5_9GAST|nr:hypothetical protein RRG08_043095 [Elysia crispata]
MVYRSSRLQAQRDAEPEGEALQEFSAETRGMDKPVQLRRQVGVWRTAAIVLAVVTLCLVVAVAVLVVKGSSGSCGGGRCGAKARNPNFIDLSEPNVPGPFHDLTKHEIIKIREFITQDPNIRAVDPEKATVDSSYMFMMDLLTANKGDILKYLDKKGPAPDRHARVIMYRGDKPVPMVEEYACGPLPDVTSCTLIKSDKRRNPVEFSLRPLSIMEFETAATRVLTQVDKKLGHFMKDVFGGSYMNCPEPIKCFKLYPSPMATNIVSDINKRRLWIWADYPLEYYSLHPVDFGILANLDGADPSKFGIDKVWFRGKLYNNMDELAAFYNSTNKNDIKRIRPKEETKDLYSSMHLRGDPKPAEPLRPPTLVEPDGIRYTLKDRKVDYMGWSFNFRLSSLTGPALYDVRYNGERIAYEIAMNEIAVFYSADNPLQRVTDFVDSGALIGTHSKSLVPGGDCPESSTFVNQTFPGQTLSNNVEIPRALCLFENNNGYPIRRHLSFAQAEGAFYNGMLDSVLTLRSALTVVNYDYIVDFIFHQNGVLESRIMSTGYIYPSFYTTAERPYGFQIAENVVGSLHHHIFHYKADLDISGTSNRYETLDIKPAQVQLRTEPRKYHLTKFERSLKKTEKEALYKFNFDYPKYHVVHNDAVKTPLKEIKAYRIGLHGMSKQLLPEGVDSEVTIPWARHQLVVTKHKDDEVISSSPYAMWDSKDPVTDFSEFYKDDENIVDQDLVFWITMGMHHIPHTEDLPVTPTVGNHLTFFLFPYNYFTDCPSMSSRDQIRIEHKDRSDPKKGVRVERYGRGDDTCSLPPYSQEYDKVLEEDPDTIVESRKVRGLF